MLGQKLTKGMNSYKYDIAISLCNEDVDFARKLVKALNPGLKVFFYEDRQEELISKSGPEAFAKCFKEEARIVIILSRASWSESFYTEIERNAIIDRTSIKNQGYGFLMVIPMEPEQVPSWYPSTKIYVDPKKYSIDLLAKFIEFKVTEEGGIVKPLTSEEYSAYFISQLKEKRRIIGLQDSSDAIEALTSEVEKLKSLFNSKVKYFSNDHYHFGISQKLFIYSTYDSHFGINNYQLYFEIQNMGFGFPIVTTQQSNLWIRLLRHTSGGRYEDIKSEQYKFFYSENISGWSLPITYSVNSDMHFNHLFTEHGNKWYDLKNPVSTNELIDGWFMELWKCVDKEFKQIL